jgi:N-methylhydantoinase A/oxoprolinase/acetone carboxylase beta subunit
MKMMTGTTVATNALLERNGERTALCVTKVSVFSYLALCF